MKTDIQTLINNVRQWGIDKGITGPSGKATLLAQLSKTQEELNETWQAAVLYGYALKNPYSVDMESGLRFHRELKDGIGDTIVTLILAAELAGLTMEECLQAAYDEIKGRTGKMVGGVFVKDAASTGGLES